LKDEIEKKNKKLKKGPRTKITNQKSEDKYPNTCNQGDHPEILNGQCESQGRREKKNYIGDIPSRTNQLASPLKDKDTTGNLLTRQKEVLTAKVSHTSYLKVVE
jgi:hypothetical protein